MQIRAGLMVALLACASMYAQNTNAGGTAQAPPPAPPQAPPAPPSVSPSTSSTTREVLKAENFVRRFSLGAMLTVGFLPTIKDNTNNTFSTAPVIDSLNTTIPNNKRIGYGVTAGVLVTNRIGVYASYIRRFMGYQVVSDIIEGTDLPTTPTDDRKRSTRNETTSARFQEIPVLVRFYGKNRSTPGPRWFAEGGAAIRKATAIRTSTTVTVSDKDTTSTTPANPTRQSIRGMVAGFGIQLVDPVGIRVIPEVRFTRWNGQQFTNLSTATQRNQLEVMVTLGW